MTEGDSGVPVNWEAYSHEELYEMLWQDADVADVSMIATEWARHRAALDTHAEVLREQRAVLLDGWQGSAAEETAARLDTLATRVEKISELAHAGQQAAQEAADALAMARAMMPAPPGKPGAPFTEASTSWAQFASGMGSPPAVPTTSTSSFASVPTSSSSFAPNYAEMFIPASANPGMGTAFGAVGSAGYSFYFGAASADQQKAQAVRAMQTYESSLTGSSRMIDQARGAIPPAAPTVRAAGPGGGGVPWASLVAAGPVRGVTAGPVGTPAVGSVVGGPGGAATPLGLGPRFGALSGVPGMPAAQLAAEAAAARGAAGHNGLVPPVGGQRGNAEDERHESQLPTIDHELFTVEVPTSPAVIGDTTGGRL